MEVKSSEAQGRHREVGSGGSVEQTREPMYKNRIRGVPGWTSEPPIAKSISIKSSVRISGGCARKAVELTLGDLRPCPEGLSEPRGEPIGKQESAEGIVGEQWCLPKAERCPLRRGEGK